MESKLSFPPLLSEEGVGDGNSKKNHLALKGTPPQKGGEDSSPPCGGGVRGGV